MENEKKMAAGKWKERKGRMKMSVIIKNMFCENQEKMKIANINLNALSSYHENQIQRNQ